MTLSHAESLQNGSSPEAAQGSALLPRPSRLLREAAQFSRPEQLQGVGGVLFFYGLSFLSQLCGEGVGLKMGEVICKHTSTGGPFQGTCNAQGLGWTVYLSADHFGNVLAECVCVCVCACLCFVGGKSLFFLSFFL